MLTPIDVYSTDFTGDLLLLLLQSVNLMKITLSGSQKNWNKSTNPTIKKKVPAEVAICREKWAITASHLLQVGIHETCSITHPQALYGLRLTIHSKHRGWRCWETLLLLWGCERAGWRVHFMTHSHHVLAAFIKLLNRDNSRTSAEWWLQ